MKKEKKKRLSFEEMLDRQRSSILTELNKCWAGLARRVFAIEEDTTLMKFNRANDKNKVDNSIAWLFLIVIFALVIGIFGLVRTFCYEDTQRSDSEIVEVVQNALDNNYLRMHNEGYTHVWDGTNYVRSYYSGRCLKDYIRENRKLASDNVKKEDFNRLMAYLDLEIVDIPAAVQEAKREVRLVEPEEEGGFVSYTTGNVTNSVRQSAFALEK